MKDASLYRWLESSGNKAAGRIADAEGAMPAEEMPASESESEELADLEDLKARVSELASKASAHMESRDCARAADAHIARASLFEGAGRHKRAMGAYKDAAMALYQHAMDYGTVPSGGLSNLHAAHATHAAAKAGGK